MVFEELGDERGRKREDEWLRGILAEWQQSVRTATAYFVLLRSFLGKGHSSGHANSQVVAAHKVGLGLLNGAPVLLQVFNLVAVRRSEIGAHASVMSRDDDTASAGGLLRVVEVAGSETGLLVGGEESLGILVLADTSKVDDRVRWKDVLEHFTSVSNLLALHNADRHTPVHLWQCSERHHQR